MKLVLSLPFPTIMLDTEKFRFDKEGQLRATPFLVMVCSCPSPPNKQAIDRWLT
jgi:hypothetical protein